MSQEYVVRIDVVPGTSRYVKGFDTIDAATTYARQSARTAKQNTFFWIHEVADSLVSKSLNRRAIQGEK